MTKIDTLLHLVNSMTKAEKRFLQLNMKTYGANKDYQTLYNLLQLPKTNADLVRNLFKKQRSKAGFDICCHHLYRLIIKNLIVFEAEKDIENILLKNLQECKILFQRSLYSDCFKLINKSQEIAQKQEKFSIFCLFARLELQMLNQLEFNEIPEEELIKKQSRLEAVSRQLRAIDNHYSLYYLIRHKQVNQGPTRSDAEREKLNDLAFNELQANVGQVKNSFEATKIHLLFQTAYFMMTANPRSGLKTCYELNDLFESNKHLWASPPVHYIYHIQGILHSLRVFGQYGEMPYFIDRLKEIVTADSKARALVNHLTFIFESYLLTDQMKYAQALHHLEHSQSEIDILQSNLPLALFAELVLQIALVRYQNKQWREAIKTLKLILSRGKSIQQLAVYPSFRLFMVIIHFDLNDFEFIAYEIRSFERELNQLAGSKQSERLILALIKKLIYTNDQEKRRLLVEKCISQLEQLMINPNEKLRIRSIDLTGWLILIHKKYGG
ncbi:hypothetical protein [Gaoshiqia sp. Z1-71]|uniref:hypothetical protein n=1 Tax=Gaoshiqia hydrogeniformans TaxID=3290090 RepID=UPI003BF779DA